MDTVLKVPVVKQRSSGFWGKIVRHFGQKDKSTLVGQMVGLLLLIVMFGFVIFSEADKLFGFTIWIAGVSVGWVTGILISPSTEFNNETEKFTKAQQILSSFLTGALAVKLLPLLTLPHLQSLFGQHLLLSRIFYFTAAAILTAIIIYYDRVYLHDQEKAKITFRNNSLGPKEFDSINIAHVNDLLKVCVTNRSKAELVLMRDDSPPSLPIPVDAATDGVLIIPANSDLEKLSIRDLNSKGNFLYVLNNNLETRAKYKLRVL